MSQLEWSYAAGYIDPVHYFRTLTANTSGGVPIATGNYPPGYRISDGVTVGGVFPAPGAQSDGTLPIRIQPVFAATTLPTNTGIYLWYTSARMDLKNTGTRTASVQIGLGVADVNGPDQPMYPWLGVQHDQDPLQGQMNSISVLGNTTQSFFCHRLDLVDQAFESTIPNYPNWTETPCNIQGHGYLLYPAVTLTYQNTSANDVELGGVHIIGFAIPY